MAQSISKARGSFWVEKRLSHPLSPCMASSLTDTNGRPAISPTFAAKLPHGLRASHLPRHVAVIMDGNSRWAERRGLAPSAGHLAGCEALLNLIWLSCTWGLTAFTPFILSTENWNRSQVEVAHLIQLCEKVLVDNLENFMRYNAQVRVIGDVSRLPLSVQGVIAEVETKTSQNSGLKLSLAINYGGRLDMIRACQQIAKRVQRKEIEIKDISERTIDGAVWTSWLGDAQYPDLIIRTSGEQRLSNFMLWQAAYSEVVFVETQWPAFSEAHFAQALSCYQNRDRRFGGRRAKQLL